MSELRERNRREISSLDLVHLLSEEIQAQKCFNVAILDVQEKTSLGVYFLVAEVFVQNHLNCVGQHLVTFLKRLSILPYVEGKSVWVLIDCGDVVVHLMLPEARSHYSLDELWSSAGRSEVSTLIN